MAGSYRAVKAEVLRRIAEGAWPPGGPVPGEAALAREFGAARATVNRALRELAEEGILERRRRAGTRVRPAPLRQARFDIPIVRREVEATGAAYAYALLSDGVEPAPAWLRGRLGLAEGERVRHLRCLHRAGDAPFQHEERWIALAALPQAEGADFSQVGPTEWLIAAVPFSEVEIGLSAVSDPAAAAALEAAPGAPLFRVERTTWWEGRGVTHVRLTFAPGHRMTTRY